MYKKRGGTSGIRGQLYETKLISLIHFRAKLDAQVKDYHLATNVDDIGTFDDICFRAKVKVNGRDKPVGVFIQAKHREGDKVLTLNSKHDLAKWFDSYLTIRRAFKPGNKHVLFKGNFDETECLFVMYTTAKDDLNTTPFDTPDLARKLNSLISTGDEGLRPRHKPDDVDFLCHIIMKEQFVALAELMARFLSEDNDNIMSMNDDLVLLYHVILVQKLVDVSDIQCRNEDDEYRIARFRTDLFASDDEYVALFRDKLYTEVLKKRKLDEEQVKSLLAELFDRPTDVNILSKLVGNVVTCNKNGKLEFVSKSMSEDLKRRLDSMYVQQTTVQTAVDLAARHILQPRRFKVPAAFGNKDLTIRGKVDVNIEGVLDKLKVKLVDLLHAASPEHIVTIDDSLGDEYLQLNAGIAGAVGNILVYDQNSKLMKFTENGQLLGELANRLFVKVQKEVKDLSEYRFRVKVNTFPKLTFHQDGDESEEMLEQQVTALAEYFGKFLGKEVDSVLSMSNQLVMRYHVLLAEKVLEVSEIQFRNEDKEHRVASFRHKFFDSDDEFEVKFKTSLYNQILKSRNIKDDEIQTLLWTFLQEPSEATALSRLMGTVVSYKNGKLELVQNNVSQDLKSQLHNVRVSQSLVDAATELAARQILQSRQFKVSASFGNKDLTITSEDGIKIDRRLNDLKLKLTQMMNSSGEEKAVSFDESLGVGFLKLSGGFGGVIGNLLVADDNPRLLKFTDNCDALEDVSKKLFKKLHSDVQNLHEYRFQVKTKTFPKLTFNADDDDDNVEILTSHLSTVAEFIGKFIFEEGESIMPMTDELVLRYHVLLAQRVVHVSEIHNRHEDEEHRVARFTLDLFDSEQDFVKIFRKSLFREVLRRRIIDVNEAHNLLTEFIASPSEMTILSRLIDTVITYTNGKFELVTRNVSEDLEQQLHKVNVPQTQVDEATELAAREILQARTFKVPAAFGNKDLTIKVEKGIKIERRLNHLKSKLAELMKNCGEDKLVTLEETLGDGLLKLSGGLAGIVGNMLVADGNTKLMRFTRDWESLGDLAKRLFVKLRDEFEDLHEYKFDVNVKKFPKLSFEKGEQDEDWAKDFLNKLLFYTNQADESGVEESLKNEIEDHESHHVDNVKVTAKAIFLHYHDEIQQWWMQPKEGPFLTKQSKIYDNAKRLILDKPLMSVMSMMYMLKIKNNMEYTFSDSALAALQLNVQPPGTVFLTENSALTIAKMAQCLKNKNYAVLDLEYIVTLQPNDYNTVCAELTKKDKDDNRTIIIVVNDINKKSSKRIENIAKVVSDKRTIVVTVARLLDTVKTHFLRGVVVNDATSSLLHLSEKSQKSILDNTKVTFQGVEVRLESIVDETSKRIVEGDVLNRIINDQPIVLSTSMSNTNYDKMKHLYIDRRVNAGNVRTRGASNTDVVLSTLYDIGAAVTLITAKPGMGKSTLLTHLSLATKQVNPTVWIVRINLLAHSEQFRRWQKHKTTLNTLKTVKFMCQAVLNEKQMKLDESSIELQQSDDTVSVKHCAADELTQFEIKLFLDYYNRRELIVLFDGFDEICPHYADEVVSLLKIAADYPRKHKVWIASRSYDNVKSILEREFGRAYEIQHLTNDEQNRYLDKFWKSEIILTELTNEQFNNVCSFMEFMSTHYNKLGISSSNVLVKTERHQALFIKVCINFLEYLKREINSCPQFVIDVFNAYNSECRHTIMFLEDFDTPLHMYLVADYFQDKVEDTNVIHNRWHLDINAFTVYERFFETKLKKIRFEEKNKIDMSNADNIIIYEKIRADFFDTHKKLGAYAVFYHDAELIFDRNQLLNIKHTIDNIKKGTEKTGLVHSVANDIPTFIHFTFTEYFAVEYICDLLRTETCSDKQTLIWDFITNVLLLRGSNNLRNILDYKIKSEETLRTRVYEHQHIIFNLLLKQGKGVHTFYEDDFSKELYLKVKRSLCSAMEDDCENFVTSLYKLKEMLTEDPLADVTRKIPNEKRWKLIRLIQRESIGVLKSSDPSVEPNEPHSTERGRARQHGKSKASVRRDESHNISYMHPSVDRRYKVVRLSRT